MRGKIPLERETERVEEVGEKQLNWKSVGSGAVIQLPDASIPIKRRTDSLSLTHDIIVVKQFSTLAIRYDKINKNLKWNAQTKTVAVYPWIVATQYPQLYYYIYPVLTVLNNLESYMRIVTEDNAWSLFSVPLANVCIFIY